MACLFELVPGVGPVNKGTIETSPSLFSLFLKIFQSPQLWPPPLELLNVGDLFNLSLLSFDCWLKILSCICGLVDLDLVKFNFVLFCLFLLLCWCFF